jgi:hypothetical protein
MAQYPGLFSGFTALLLYFFGQRPKKSRRQDGYPMRDERVQRAAKLHLNGPLPGLAAHLPDTDDRRIAIVKTELDPHLAFAGDNAVESRRRRNRRLRQLRFRKIKEK